MPPGAGGAAGICSPASAASGLAGAPAGATDAPARCVAVACSGGRDSMALLHATGAFAARHGLHVVALHVHHGLSPQADAWETTVRDTCRRWARRGWPLAFRSERLSGAPARGDSVEAWARDGRYRALGAMAQAAGASLLLLAQHRRDQAETFLLQALRGAGVDGLSSMPASVERGGIVWARPWLDQSRDAIDAYVRRHRIAHVDDDSNADTRYARNRLRLESVALIRAFPDAEATLAAAARWSQQAVVAHAETRAGDLASITREAGAALDRRAWLALPPARRGEALRAWLRERLGRPAPASLLRRLADELPAATSARWPVAGGELRCHRGMLRLDPARKPGHGAVHETTPLAAAQEAASEPPHAPASAAVPCARPIDLRRAGVHPLPDWGGSLVLRRVREGGVPVAWLAQAEMRARQGGERFQAGLGRPPRSLKKQFQAAALPAWQRDGPLVYSGGQLVFVPGLGVDARMIGLPGQAMLALEWRADALDPTGTPGKTGAPD